MAWKRDHFFHPSLKRPSFLTPPGFIKDKRVIYAHTYRRNSSIPTTVLGKRVAVFNGLTFMSFLVRDWMLGRKFGEFVLTKRLGSKIHEKIIKKKKQTQRK